MRKLIIMLTALLLPLFAFEMGADDEITVVKIPLKVESHGKLNRSLADEPLVANYIGATSCIQTTVFSDLGQVELTVTNCSTGEVWCDSFDSASAPQTLLPISGTSGLYEVVYLTETGDIYQGTFNR